MAKGCFRCLSEPLAVVTEELRFNFIGIEECDIFDRMLVVLLHFYQLFPVNRTIRRAKSSCNVSIFQSWWNKEFAQSAAVSLSDRWVYRAKWFSHIFNVYELPNASNFCLIDVRFRFLVFRELPALMVYCAKVAFKWATRWSFAVSLTLRSSLTAAFQRPSIVGACVLVPMSDGIPVPVPMSDRVSGPERVPFRMSLIFSVCPVPLPFPVPFPVRVRVTV